MKPEYPDSVIEQALAEASKQALQAQMAELIKQHGWILTLDALKQMALAEAAKCPHDVGMRQAWYRIAERLDSSKYLAKIP